MKKLVVLLSLLLCPLLMGQAYDPATVIPTYTKDTFKVPGLITGDNPKFSERDVEIINWVTDGFSKVFDKPINIDMAVCNASSMPIEDALKCLTDIVKDMPPLLYETDMFFWGPATMTVQEFVDAVHVRIESIEARLDALESQ